MFNRNYGQPDFNNTDTLKALVPSIFETSHSYKVSDRYQQIATFEIVKAMQESGWKITKAMQSHSKSDSHAKHMLRFRSSDIQPILGDLFPEVVLVNSHDGTSTYQLRAGIYRLVCSNGLVLGTDQFCERVRHFGKNIPELVAEGAARIISQLPHITEKVISLSQTAINPMGERVFAIRAIDARLDADISDEEKQREIGQLDTRGIYRGFYLPQLLSPRRTEDKPKTIWNVLNTIQEKMIRGGIHGGKNRRNIRAIKSVDRDIALNTSLFSIAEDLQKMHQTGQLS